MSGVRRVIVGASVSPGSLRALRYADELARAHDATLMPVLTWLPPGGELADRRSPCGYLRCIWQEDACDRLPLSTRPGHAAVEGARRRPVTFNLIMTRPDGRHWRGPAFDQAHWYRAQERAGITPPRAKGEKRKAARGQGHACVAALRPRLHG
jgi:hypothetical protein